MTGHGVAGGAPANDAAASPDNAADNTAGRAFRRDMVMFKQWQQQLEREGEAPRHSAATVVVLRDGADGVESLMLRRNSKIAFGGMWVFPGGRIDSGDYHSNSGDHDSTDDLMSAACRAAAREALEEAAIVLDPAELVHFSFWIPPPIAPKRFATWFFAAKAPKEGVTIDDGEIVHHEWMTPAEAMRRRDAAEIDLVIPTWVTLHTLRRFVTVADALDGLRRRRPRSYETRIGRSADGPVSMWHGDAGYETADASVPGPRHRLEITPLGYLFDESGYTEPQ